MTKTLWFLAAQPLCLSLLLEQPLSKSRQLSLSSPGTNPLPSPHWLSISAPPRSLRPGRCWGERDPAHWRILLLTNLLLGADLVSKPKSCSFCPWLWAQANESVLRCAQGSESPMSPPHHKHPTPRLPQATGASLRGPNTLPWNAIPVLHSSFRSSWHVTSSGLPPQRQRDKVLLNTFLL